MARKDSLICSQRCDNLKPKCTNCRVRELDCKYCEVPMMSIRVQSTPSFKPPSSHSTPGASATKIQKAKSSPLVFRKQIATTASDTTADDTTTDDTTADVNLLNFTSSLSPQLSVSAHDSGFSDTDITSIYTSSPKAGQLLAELGGIDDKSLLNSDTAITAALGRGTPSLSTLPARHTLLPGRLLRWPKVSMLATTQFDFSHSILSYEARQAVDFPNDTAAARPNALDLLLPDKLQIDVLIDSFMLKLYHSYPIFDLDVVRRLIERCQTSGTQYTVTEGSLLAIIFALGCQPHSILTKYPHFCGLSEKLYALCNYWLPSFMRHATIMSVQVLILMSAYESAQCRPMGSYRLYSLAWANLQVLLGSDSQSHVGLEWDLTLRSYWSLFIFDSQLRAEFELAPLGIGTLESEIELPCGISENDATLQPYGGILIWYYLYASISCRRLFNRIHSTLYSQDPAVALMKPGLLISTTEELQYQLETWRDSLPPQLKFTSDSNVVEEAYAIPMDDRLIYGNIQSITTLLTSSLKVHYDVICIIVNRFYLYYILHTADISPQRDALVEKWFYDKAKICVTCEMHSEIPRMFLDMGSALLLPSYFAHSVALMMAFMASEDLGFDREEIRESATRATVLARERIAPKAGITYAISDRLEAMWEKLQCSYS